MSGQYRRIKVAELSIIDYPVIIRVNGEEFGVDRMERINNLIACYLGDETVGMFPLTKIRINKHTCASYAWEQVMA